jgi:hypothetical protein
MPVEVAIAQRGCVERHRPGVDDAVTRVEQAVPVGIGKQRAPFAIDIDFGALLEKARPGPIRGTIRASELRKAQSGIVVRVKRCLGGENRETGWKWRS